MCSGGFLPQRDVVSFRVPRPRQRAQLRLEDRVPSANCPLRMRCVSSMPAIVVAAFLNRLKSSITARRCFTHRWVLLNQIIQLFRRTHLRFQGQQAIALQFARRTVRGSVAVQRDRLRGAPLAFDRFAKERLGSTNITAGAQPEVDSPARPVNGSVDVAPLAPDFDVSLVDPPRRIHRRAEPSPPLLERGHVTLHPPHDGGVDLLRKKWRAVLNQAACLS
jgi:hypothetical protein